MAVGPATAPVGQESSGVFNHERTDQEMMGIMLINLNEKFTEIQNDQALPRHRKISILKSFVEEKRLEKHFKF